MSSLREAASGYRNRLSSWNRKAVDRRDFEHVFPTLSELGEIVTAADLPLMRIELIAAIVDAMPSANENAETPSENASAFHEGHQRAMFVDVITQDILCRAKRLECSTTWCNARECLWT